MKQTVILLGECKITIHRDLRNALVLLWVVQAAKITMQNVADNYYYYYYYFFILIRLKTYLKAYKRIKNYLKIYK